MCELELSKIGLKLFGSEKDVEEDGRVHEGDLRGHLGPVTIVGRTQLVVGQHLVGVGVRVGVGVGAGVRVRVRGWRWRWGLGGGDEVRVGRQGPQR